MTTTQAIQSGITYRRMTEVDLPTAHDLSQAMRWPHRIEDWQFVHRLGIGFVAEADSAVIGTGLCWKQGNEHGTLGMIIVSEHYQGKGIGRKLMNLVLEALGDCSTRLIATQAGQPLYESLGFQTTGTIYQHQGTLKAIAPIPAASHTSIRLATPDDTGSIVGLANRATGMVRDAVLQQLMSIAEVAVLECNNELTGFAIMRRFGRGHAIGPVVAQNSDSAKALIAYWSDAYAGSFVRIDVTGESGLGAWLAEAALTQVDTGVLMERNPLREQEGVFKQFSIVNQALC